MILQSQLILFWLNPPNYTAIVMPRQRTSMAKQISKGNKITQMLRKGSFLDLKDASFSIEAPNAHSFSGSITHKNDEILFSNKNLLLGGSGEYVLDISLGL